MPITSKSNNGPDSGLDKGWNERVELQFLDNIGIVNIHNKKISMLICLNPITRTQKHSPLECRKGIVADPYSASVQDLGLNFSLTSFLGSTLTPVILRSHIPQ